MDRYTTHRTRLTGLLGSTVLVLAACTGGASRCFIGAQPARLPLTVLVSNLVNSLGGQWELLTAAAFVMMALPIAVFFALQRYFVRGITGGAVKG